MRAQFLFLFIQFSTVFSKSCNMRLCKACEHLGRIKVSNALCTSLERSGCCEVFSDRFNGLTGATGDMEEFDPVKITKTAAALREREISIFALCTVCSSIILYILTIFFIEKIVKTSCQNSTARCYRRFTFF